MCQKYNGWTNYQTWNVKTWLDNEVGSYEMAREIARNSNGESSPRQYVADNLKELIDGANPIAGEASMFTDILQAALDDVDWYEIADAYLEEAIEAGELTLTCYYCEEEVDGEIQDADGDYLCPECHEEQTEKTEVSAVLPAVDRCEG